MIYGLRSPRPNDTLTKTLRAPDIGELADWLRSRPLLSQNKKTKTLLCHAGVYPWWSVNQALEKAAEVEAVFADEKNCIKLLKKIYSNNPSKWSDDLSHTLRSRFIINAFTRMRFCSPQGHLNLSESGYNGASRKNRIPWFDIYNPGLDDYRVVFGHWSALGFLNRPQFLCLDSGYVWGRDMTMVKLPNKMTNKKITKKRIYRTNNE
jgi:bis(5'-nucleosyl)-tetraphosphatase (symmetrical)